MKNPALFIEVTRRCNNRCRYCGKWRYGGDRDKEWRVEDYRKLFSMIKEMDFPRINFTGGEPTLREDIEEMMASAIEMIEKEIHFTTNGSLIIDKKSLWELPITLIKININTTDEEIYSKITGANHFSKVIQGIDYLINKNKKIRLHAVIFKESIHTVFDLISFCDQRKIDLKLFQIDTDLSSCDKRRVEINHIERFLKNSSLKGMVNESPGLPIHVYYRKDGNEIHLVKSQFPKYNLKLCNGCKKYPCDYGLYSVSIDPQGYVYPCLIQPDRGKVKLNLMDEQGIYSVLQEMTNLIKGV